MRRRWWLLGALAVGMAWLRWRADETEAERSALSRPTHPDTQLRWSGATGPGLRVGDRFEHEERLETLSEWVDEGGDGR